MSLQVSTKILPHFDRDLPLPCYQTKGAVGADICACLGKEQKMFIAPGQRVLIPTGLSLEIPMGFEIQVRPRSGLSFKTTLMVVNSPGTIDSDYRGELKILMGNLGDKEQMICHGDRIAQLVLAPVLQAQFVEVDDLSKTERAEGGFGSTGRNYGLS